MSWERFEMIVAEVVLWALVVCLVGGVACAVLR